MFWTQTKASGMWGLMFRNFQLFLNNYL